jgi:16S rRNA processing protein RimM
VSDEGVPARPEHLVVGHISKPHGTKGEVFVWPLTDRVDEVFVPGRELILGDGDGGVPEDAEQLSIDGVRPFKRGVLVKFQDLDDRNAVEPYNGTYLLLPVSALAPREEGEVFYHELLGLSVVTVGGEAVGRVREVFDIEPAHLIEVKSDSGKVRLIPFTKQIVRDVNLDKGVLVIDPPEGLLDV